VTAWSESWSPPEGRLHDLGAGLRDRGAVVVSGGDFDRWDCEVRGGALGATRVRLLVEEHGRGRQLARFRVWPHASARGIVLVIALAAAALAATFDAARSAGMVFALMAAAVAGRMLYECAASMATTIDSLFSRAAPAAAVGHGPRPSAPELPAAPALIEDPEPEDVGLAGPAK
jgi:hypothetical protein